MIMIMALMIMMKNVYWFSYLASTHRGKKEDVMMMGRRRRRIKMMVDFHDHDCYHSAGDDNDDSLLRVSDAISRLLPLVRRKSN